MGSELASAAALATTVAEVVVPWITKAGTVVDGAAEVYKVVKGWLAPTEPEEQFRKRISDEEVLKAEVQKKAEADKGFADALRQSIKARPAMQAKFITNIKARNAANIVDSRNVTINFGSSK